MLVYLLCLCSFLNVKYLLFSSFVDELVNSPGKNQILIKNKNKIFLYSMQIINFYTILLFIIYFIIYFAHHIVHFISQTTLIILLYHRHSHIDNLLNMN